MSVENAREVVRLAAVSQTFRSAFRADSSQAMTLFASDLTLTGDGSLTQDEIDAIRSISDDEFAAFVRIAGVLSAPLVGRVGSSFAYL
ncbi:MAG: hypothetical protein RL748_180 [Pseudomonadota bacterium]